MLIARMAAAQVAAFEKLSAEGAMTLTVVNERNGLVSPIYFQGLEVTCLLRNPSINWLG